MKLTLNGHTREVGADATLSDLLASLQLADKLVLVELNGLPVKRADFPMTTLAEGDGIEIVRMIGGG
jgi:sulfur carrier protein